MDPRARRTGRRALLLVFTLVVASGIALDVAPALAQEAELEEIIVTGSRIARPDFESAAPVVTVQRALFEETPYGSVEATLGKLPQFGWGRNSSSNAYGSQGQAQIALRGLLSSSTLVLIDGRRLVPTNGSGVPDVNVVPPALIQRVEILTGGASAVYGTDALAGVVNMHLLDTFEGIEFGGNWNVTGRGDGETYTATITAGTNFADGRGAVMGAVGYYDRSLVTEAARRYSRVALGWYGAGTDGVGPGGQFLPQGSSNIVEGRVIFGNNRPSAGAFDRLFTSYGYAPGAVPYPQNVGFNADGSLFTMGNSAPGSVANFRGTRDPLLYNDRNFTYNYAPYQAMQMPLERTSVFVNGSFEFDESVELYAQGLFADYTVDEQLAPTPIPFAYVPATNPYIPPDLKSLLDSRSNATAPFRLSKRTLELGPRVTENQYSFYQFALGLRGAVLSDWQYNGYVQYGQNDQTFESTGNVSVSKFEELLSAPDGGVALCGGADPFGENSISAECARYMAVALEDSAKTQQTTAEFTLTGSLLELPAGELSAVFGLFYQENRYQNRPDPAGQNVTPDGRPDIAGSTAAGEPMDADDNNFDAYMEVLVPLVEGKPGVESLDVVLGYRWSDYASAGTANTYKAELLYEPVDAVHLRGSFQRAVRAPSIFERYEPQVAQNVAIPNPDPCSFDSEQRSGPDGASVAALCVQQGILASEIATFYDYSGQAPGFFGGNPDLTPEEGRTWTAGVVFDSPFGSRALQDLQVSIDWWSIRITDAIAYFVATDYVPNCYDPKYNPGFGATNQYCTWFSREPETGYIVDAYNINRNFAVVETKGIDLQLDWRMPAGPGEVGATWLVSWLETYEVQSDPKSAPKQWRGTGCCPVLPEWKWNLDARYLLQGWTVAANWTYVGHIDGREWFVSAPSFQVPVRNYVDFTGGYSFREGTLDGLTLRLGITNVLDEQPPIFPAYATANSDGTAYDLLGRTYWVSMTYAVRPGPE